MSTSICYVIRKAFKISKFSKFTAIKMTQTDH